MSTIYLTIIILGLIGTAIFVAGFAKGLRDAIADYRSGTPDTNETDETSYGPSTVAAVAASALMIAAVGFSPYWVYAGPLLAIVTGAGVGVAFFMDRAPMLSKKAT
jgi:hypothetical protein